MAKVQAVPSSKCEKTVESFHPPRNPSICMKAERAIQIVQVATTNGTNAFMDARSFGSHVNPKRSRSAQRNARPIQARSASSIQISNLRVFIPGRSRDEGWAYSRLLRDAGTHAREKGVRNTEMQVFDNLHVIGGN